MKKGKLCRALGHPGGEGGGGKCTRGQQVTARPAAELGAGLGAGLGPSGAPPHLPGHGAFPHSGAALDKRRRSNSSSLFQ